MVMVHATHEISEKVKVEAVEEQERLLIADALGKRMTYNCNACSLDSILILHI
jgi:hypothetical protein